MQCDEARKHLFQYSDGSLPELERQAVDQHLQQCNECSEALREIWEMALLATSWVEQSVPRWNRRTLFFGESAPALPWLNLAGVAASLVVLIVLIFQVEVQSSDSGYTLTFAGDRDTFTREELERRFEARDEAVAQALEVTAQRLTAQQVATNQLLLRTILETSRQERREDLMDVMTVWNADQQRMEQLTEQSIGYLIRTQLAGQRQLQELSTAVRNLDIREDNNL